MPSSSPEHTSLAFKRVRWVIAGLASLAIVFGLAIMIGWAARLTTLVQPWPNRPPMQFNTGLCFVLAGLALAAWARRRKRFVPPILGGIVAALGGSTLLEFLAHQDFGIDQLFFHDFLGQQAYAGRMPAVSAACLLLIGLSLMLLSRRGSQHLSWLAGSMAVVVMSVASNALFGYVFGLPGADQWGKFARMAPHGAVGFIVLAGGLAIAAWQSGCHPGERTPRWLPVPLTLGAFARAVILFFAVAARQNHELSQTIHVGASSVQREISTRLEDRARNLTHMARRWEYNGHPQQTSWEHDASLYAQDFPDVQAVEWIDPSGYIRWGVPATGNEAKIGLQAAREARRVAAMEQARLENRAIFSKTVELLRGGLGVIIYTPVHTPEGEFEGWLAAVFEIPSFLDRSLSKDIAASQTLRLSEKGRTFYTRDPAPMPDEKEWVARGKIEVPGASWDLVTWPTRELKARTVSALPIAVLVVGLIHAFLVGGICYFAQRHSRISRARAATAAELQRALDDVKTLEGLLPICTGCKRVRDDTGYWNQIDTYLYRHTDAELSHGYCPECAAKAFTAFGLDIPERIQAELVARNFE